MSSLTLPPLTTPVSGRIQLSPNGIRAIDNANPCQRFTSANTAGPPHRHGTSFSSSHHSPHTGVVRFTDLMPGTISKKDILTNYTTRTQSVAHHTHQLRSIASAAANSISTSCPLSHPSSIPTLDTRTTEFNHRAHRPRAVGTGEVSARAAARHTRPPRHSNRSIYGSSQT